MTNLINCYLDVEKNRYSVIFIKVYSQGIFLKKYNPNLNLISEVESSMGEINGEFEY